MSTFLDANVLLETLLEGRQKAAQAEAAIVQATRPAISPLVVHLYVYFGQREGHAVGQLLEDLRSYIVLPLGPEHIAWASANRQDDDFEDALQIACAVLEGCTAFVTFDKTLARRYSRFITIHTP